MYFFSLKKQNETYEEGKETNRLRRKKGKEKRERREAKIEREIEIETKELTRRQIKNYRDYDVKN